MVRWKWSICRTEHLPLALEFGGDGVGEFARRLAGALGGPLYVDAMLVGAGGEHGVVTLHAFEALDQVGDDSGVRVADVRRGIHVVDGSGEIVFHRDSGTRSLLPR